MAFKNKEGKTVKPKRQKLEKYEKYSDLLEGLWLRWLELGRKPKIDEIESADTDQFGTLGKALKFLIEFKDAALLEKAEEIRKNNILVFLALELFNQRTPFSERDKTFRTDLKYFLKHHPRQKNCKRFISSCRWRD